ncbi:hypothetical protein L1987_03541 [Smallanthus sonchifolius]|uniref:Uncharacterized protein n=1 Tax=Smallanthus sonchifolius TaxID=185202 RepID=A0ACB9KAY4_9ASTR|nr:hypothetical protein L1987_03541 [Smallanthus sonchifolius]
MAGTDTWFWSYNLHGLYGSQCGTLSRLEKSCGMQCSQRRLLSPILKLTGSGRCSRINISLSLEVDPHPHPLSLNKSTSADVAVESTSAGHNAIANLDFQWQTFSHLKLENHDFLLGSVIDPVVSRVMFALINRGVQLILDIV